MTGPFGSAPLPLMLARLISWQALGDDAEDAMTGRLGPAAAARDPHVAAWGARLCFSEQGAAWLEK